MRFWENC